MNTKHTIIHPDVLVNLTKDMEPMKRRAMELLNQGKNRRWVYWLIWAMWLIIIPFLEIFSIYGYDLSKGLVLVVLSINPLVYMAMLHFYTQVKIWEKQHRTNWEELLKKDRELCIFLGVDRRDPLTVQIKKVGDDLATLVDSVVKAQESVRVKEREVFRLAKMKDGEGEKRQIESDIAEENGKIKKSQEHIRQKLDLAKVRFAGDFEETKLKYRELFQLGEERFTKKTIKEEVRTRSPFLTAN